MSGLFVMIPIMILGIAVSGIISASILKMQRLRLEEAKLRVGDSGDIDQLAARVVALEQELAEVHERLDFTERLLVQGRAQAELPPASRSP